MILLVGGQKETVAAMNPGMASQIASMQDQFESAIEMDLDLPGALGFDAQHQDQPARV